jgi:hypothetical protein
VDALHNLYLGTANRMMTWWKTNINPATGEVYLSNTDFKDMAEKAKLIIVPPQFTPISHKIASGFSGLKGDEWRSWVFVYSSLLLKGKITGNAMTCWMKFLKVNQVLGWPSITDVEIKEAHKLLKEFGKECADIYGINLIPPNFHLHLHLKNTIRDFGPIYSTWLYGMERDGDIKDVNTNFKQGLEATFMKKYLQHVHAKNYIKGFSARIFNNPVMMGVLSSLVPGVVDSFVDDEVCLGNVLGRNTQCFDLATFINHSTDDTRLVRSSEPLHPSFSSSKHIDRYVVMSNSHYQCLADFYKNIYKKHYTISEFHQSHQTITSTAIITNTIERFTEIDLLGQKIRSLASRTKRSLYIQASINGEMRVGRVNYFFSNQVKLPVPNTFEVQPTKHVFAFVEWFEKSTLFLESFNVHYASIGNQPSKTLTRTQFYLCIVFTPAFLYNLI